MTDRKPYTTFSPADIQALEPALKIGILATVNDDGLPHLTLISSLKANTSTQLTWGQFTEGLSKRFIHTHPKVGWLMMTLDKQLWRGKAAFTHTAQTGPEFEAYNNVPMFRYNAYFGIHTVYYMDLVEHTGRRALPMGQVVLAAVQTIVARTLSRPRASAPVLNPWTRRLLNKLDNLKFLSYVGADGYPLVIPAIQAQAAGPAHVLFSTGAFGPDLAAIPSGATVALFGMSLDMEDVLMRGEFQGICRVAGIRCGSIAVNWVYNPMPPKPQQIYPPVAVKPVTIF
jgi:hypothetical protein